MGLSGNDRGNVVPKIPTAELSPPEDRDDGIRTYRRGSMPGPHYFAVGGYNSSPSFFSNNLGSTGFENGCNATCAYLSHGASSTLQLIGIDDCPLSVTLGSEKPVNAERLLIKENV